MTAKGIKVTIAPKNGDRKSPSDSAFLSVDTQNNLEAALTLFKAGFRVIPILPRKKIPACKHHPWLEELSTENIKAYWNKHPDHEIGCITGDDIIVFDVDTPESTAALLEIEFAFDVTPNFVVKTAKGYHHYLRLKPGTFAKSDAHSSEKFPDRIDIRTGSGLVVMPPSTGKSIKLCEISHVDELVKVGQDFVDAVNRHNGRNAPRISPIVEAPRQKREIDSQELKELDALVSHIDPDSGYQDWINAGMALHYETSGSDEGLSIFDDWSGQGGKYPGYAAIHYKWNSLRDYTGIPVTKATLCKMVADGGYDWVAILDRLRPQFQKCDYEIVDTEGNQIPFDGLRKTSVLDKYSITGMSAEIEAHALAEVFVLDGLALLGQWTLFYAKYNAGKTLLVLHLLIGAIRRGDIDGSKVFYYNLDDNQSGLLAKLKIAEKVGFNIIAEGYLDFKVCKFLDHIEKMCESDQAREIVLILDTLKKFTDLMDKRSTSRWNQVIRRFIAKGGTVIGLAHVNKKRGNDGKLVHAGTTDLVDDADCAFVLDEIGIDHKTQIKTVEFQNLKRRGNVVNSVSYCYSNEEGIDYNRRLASVERVNSAQLTHAKHTQDALSDAAVIEIIEACINDGFVTKMRLRDEINKRARISKRMVLDTLEKYTGEDPSKHRWFYITQRHGRKVYQLLSK